MCVCNTRKIYIGFAGAVIVIPISLQSVHYGLSFIKFHSPPADGEQPSTSPQKQVLYPVDSGEVSAWTLK